jgi:hypothetical protein
MMPFDLPIPWSLDEVLVASSSFLASSLKRDLSRLNHPPDFSLRIFAMLEF